MSLQETLRRHGGDLSGYRLFCIERSPYSKVLSVANWRARVASYTLGGAMRAYTLGGAVRADHQQLTRALDLSIEDGSISLVSNIDLYRGSDGRVAAHVLRYAELRAPCTAS
jgi:hypothetical protein